MKQTKNTVYTATHKFGCIPYTLAVTLYTENRYHPMDTQYTHTKTGQKVVPTKKEQRKMAAEYYTKAIPTIYQELANKSGLGISHQNNHSKYQKFSKIFEPINS